MSVNKRDSTTGELVTLASGTRMWVGTKSAHDIAVANGTMPNNVMVCITDDYPTKDGLFDNSEFTFNTTVVGESFTTPVQQFMRVARSGNLVIVELSHLTFTLANTLTQDTILCSGLPKPLGNTFATILFLDTNTITDMFVRNHNNTGELMLSPGHPGTITAGDKQLYGTLIYYAED